MLPADPLAEFFADATRPRPRPDIEQARRWVEGLTGSATTPMVWGTRLDHGDKGGWQTHRGTVDELWPILVALNDHGHAVFGGINDDGRVRAVCLDVDHDKHQRLTIPPGFPPPSLVVRTGRGEHAYWRLAPGASADAFVTVQAGLARHLGGDRALQGGVGQMMRVAGFLHAKDPTRPLPVVVASAVEAVYPIEDLAKASGVDLGRAGEGTTTGGVVPARELAAKEGVPERPSCPPDMSSLPAQPAHLLALPSAATVDRWARLQARNTRPSVSGERGHWRAYRIANVLVHGYQLDDDHALAILVEEFSPRCDPPWSPRDLQKKIAKARRDPSHVPGVGVNRISDPQWSLNPKLVDLVERVDAAVPVGASAEAVATILDRVALATSEWSADLTARLWRPRPSDLPRAPYDPEVSVVEWAWRVVRWHRKARGARLGTQHPWYPRVAELVASAGAELVASAGAELDADAILRHLGIDRPVPADARAVGLVMSALGWTCERHRRGGHQVRVYRRPSTTAELAVEPTPAPVTLGADELIARVLKKTMDAPPRPTPTTRTRKSRSRPSRRDQQIRNAMEVMARMRAERA